ncbi:MAG: LPS assembly protein LptD, partial [Gallionellaceae bacterium]|nr:LPS assembly protein LptD [Gallionellaceae bacterium]
GQVTHAWSLDSIYQYNPNQSHSEKFNMAARYQPESGKVLNLGYRFTRSSLRQVDISTQWPFSSRWHGLARWNYSLQDKHTLEALAGLEYNQSCWKIRMVAQHFATATQKTTTSFFVQLELNGLVQIGPDPASVLNQSIPGYTKRTSSSDYTPIQGLH